MAAGEAVDVAQLAEAVAGLCQARNEAATDPEAAKTVYGRRSQHGINMTVRALQPSNSLLASSITKAVEQVQPDGATMNAFFADNLARLGALVREGLARLGVPSAPCET
jgi:hypothetical protein